MLEFRNPLQCHLWNRMKSTQGENMCLFILKRYLISGEGNNFPDIQTLHEKHASFSLNVSAVKKMSRNKSHQSISYIWPRPIKLYNYILHCTTIQDPVEIQQFLPFGNILWSQPLPIGQTKRSQLPSTGQIKLSQLLPIGKITGSYSYIRGAFYFLQTDHLEIQYIQLAAFL